MDGNKKIIGLVGEQGSGKGYVAKYLQEKVDADIYRFSTPLRDVIQRLHCEISRDNMVKTSKALRDALGQDLFSKALYTDIKKSGKNFIVVDGVRRWDDLNFFKSLKNFILVSIEVAPEVRYERLVKRAENEGDTDKTYEDFLKDHKKETEIAITEIMKTADIKIDNNGDIDNLIKQIKRNILN